MVIKTRFIIVSVEYNIRRTKAEDLKPLHRILFKRVGTVSISSPVVLTSCLLDIYLISVHYRNLMCFNGCQLYISSKFNLSQ